MMKLRRWIEHVLSFSSQHLWAFVLLSFGAMIQAMNIVLYDSLATALYLGHFGQQDLAFNFFVASLFICLAGYFTVKHSRFLGKGFVFFLLLAAFLQTSLMYAIAYHIPLSFFAFPSTKNFVGG